MDKQKQPTDVRPINHQLALDKKMLADLNDQYEALKSRRLQMDPNAYMKAWVSLTGEISNLESKMSERQYLVDREQFLLPPKDITQKMIDMKEHCKAYGVPDSNHICSDHCMRLSEMSYPQMMRTAVQEWCLP